jgi:hypothetical protein
MLCSSLNALITITKIIIGNCKKVEGCEETKTTTAPKRKRGSSKKPIRLDPFVSPFCCRSCYVFSGFFPWRFLVPCRWFSASLLSGNGSRLVQYCCVLKGSQTSFRAMTSNHIRRTLLSQWNEVRHTEALPGRMEKPLWKSRMK